MPLSFALLTTLVVGVLLGLTVGFLKNIKLRRKISALSREATIAKKEVTNLRTLPVNSSN